MVKLQLTDTSHIQNYALILSKVGTLPRCALILDNPKCVACLWSWDYILLKLQQQFKLLLTSSLHFQSFFLRELKFVFHEDYLLS